MIKPRIAVPSIKGRRETAGYTLLAKTVAIDLKVLSHPVVSSPFSQDPEHSATAESETSPRSTSFAAAVGLAAGLARLAAV
jgi:hypothetical protein